MTSDSQREDIVRRKISDNDASLLTRATIGTARTGFTALPLISGDPSATILASLAAEMAENMLIRHEHRITNFFSVLMEKIQSLPKNSKERWKSQFDSEEGQQLFEEAWYQAAETVDPEKVEAIAALVKNSLSAEDLQLYHARWLLRLLDQLDAIEMILLQSHSEQCEKDATFFEQHRLIFEDAKEPKKLSPQEYFSSHDESLLEGEQAQRAEEEQKFEIARERHSLYVSRTNHLVDMGLLGDKNQTQVSELTLTPLGAALLKIIDLADDKERGKGEQANVVQVMRQTKAQADGLRRKISEDAEREKQNIRNMERTAQSFKRNFERGLQDAARRYL